MVPPGGGDRRTRFSPRARSCASCMMVRDCAIKVCRRRSGGRGLLRQIAARTPHPRLRRARPRLSAGLERWPAGWSAKSSASGDGVIRRGHRRAHATRAAAERFTSTGVVSPLISPSRRSACIEMRLAREGACHRSPAQPERDDAEMRVEERPQVGHRHERWYARDAVSHAPFHNAGEKSHRDEAGSARARCDRATACRSHSQICGPRGTSPSQAWGNTSDIRCGPRVGTSRLYPTPGRYRSPRVNGSGRIELIDLSPVRPIKITPAHFLDKHLSGAGAKPPRFHPHISKCSKRRQRESLHLPNCSRNYCVLRSPFVLGNFLVNETWRSALATA